MARKQLFECCCFAGFGLLILVERASNFYLAIPADDETGDCGERFACSHSLSKGGLVVMVQTAGSPGRGDCSGVSQSRDAQSCPLDRQDKKGAPWPNHRPSFRLTFSTASTMQEKEERVSKIL
jgi:hypothetical protein